MSNKFSDFFTHSIKNFFNGLINIFIFLPYFFSVKTLFSTLFSPWKRIVSEKTRRGFSLADWFNRWSFDMISRGMGFVMRTSLIIFYFILQCLLIILLPIILLIYVILLPFLFLITLFSKTDEEMKQEAKQLFISRHMLKEENFQIVEQWFERDYAKNHINNEWWKLENLTATPPLARDWSIGYTPTLDEYTVDLTNSSYQTHIYEHMIGRKKESKLIEDALSKSEEANVILVGEEGVGKHTIIHALVQRIFEGKVNNILSFKRVLEVNMEKVLTQHNDQKQREQFFEQLMQEAVQAKHVILLINNIDRYISYGENRIDLTTSLEKYGKTSDIQILGITTPFLYQKYVFSNDKISRLFTKIDVEEITNNEALQVLMDTNPHFEQRYKLYIPYETLIDTIDKSDFFITTVPFPEKAMQLLDTACVYTTETLKKNVVVPEVVDYVLSQKTHTPVTVTPAMKERLLKLEELLSARVVNQADAVRELSSALRRSFILLGKRRKPLATFLFLGPTGVGKTETAKAITNIFFGDEKYMLRFDMSLFQTKEDIPKLIGSIETQNAGLLTTAVREQPYGILLLDEIEKADKNLLNIFLTILDEGYYTDGYGKRVDCKNLMIIATSNAGAQHLFALLNNKTTPDINVTAISADAHATAIPEDVLHPNATSLTTNSLISYLIEKQVFSPEFLNRFDGVVAYHPLQNESAILIAKKMLSAVLGQIYSLYKVKVNVSDVLLRKITDEGYDPAFGARNMDRILREQIEDRVARMILEGSAKEGDVINL